jgi:hypothetical protein
VDVERGGDLVAVDDEGFLELILELGQLPHGGVDDAEGSQQQGWGAAEPGLGLAGLAVDAVDQLAGGPGVGSLGRAMYSAS